MKQLPQEYLNTMKELLGEKYEEFLYCYDNKFTRGLRFNKKKARPDTIEKLIHEWHLEPVSWCQTGYYYPEDVRPGLSPYHDAGLYYMQEPSAMIVAETAALSGKEKVLDLCAAPGGKTTRLSEDAKVLLSNEIHPQRARILSSNIERMGFGNCLVSSASPAELAALFPDYFDVVVCDAPCSGEGMMRRDDIAVSEWSPENVAMCVARQAEILDAASMMVSPGGKLIYSTCTFETSENEEQIAHFLLKHPEFHPVSSERMWPHEVRGEGHFCALCVKEGHIKESAESSEQSLNELERRLSAAKLHILRKGILPGEIQTDKSGKKRYIPSHAEIMASVFSDCTSGINLIRTEDAEQFLHGEVLRTGSLTAPEIKGTDGYLGVYFDGYPLGLGKRTGDMIKNHLPKGLRH